MHVSLSRKEVLLVAIVDPIVRHLNDISLTDGRYSIHVACQTRPVYSVKNIYMPALFRRDVVLQGLSMCCMCDGLSRRTMLPDSIYSNSTDLIREKGIGVTWQV